MKGRNNDETYKVRKDVAVSHLVASGIKVPIVVGDGFILFCWDSIDEEGMIGLYEGDDSDYIPAYFYNDTLKRDNRND